MRWTDRMERRLRPYAIPNLTNIILVFQVVVYAATLMSNNREAVYQQFALIPAEVFDGEWWRVFSYIMLPPRVSVIWAFFYFYLFHLMGNALEGRWGSVGYNAFLAIGLTATAGVGLAAAALIPGTMDPEFPINNEFVYGSIFFAFAYLFPDFQLLLFFLIPVKIRYLAWLNWAGYAFFIVFVGGAPAIASATSVVNFFIFFGPDILSRMAASKRRMEQAAAKMAAASRPTHVCQICGITNLTHPDEQFRYCSKCSGTHAYCEAHLRNHEHVSSE